MAQEKKQRNIVDDSKRHHFQNPATYNPDPTGFHGLPTPNSMETVESQAGPKSRWQLPDSH